MRQVSTDAPSLALESRVSRRAGGDGLKAASFMMSDGSDEAVSGVMGRSSAMVAEEVMVQRRRLKGLEGREQVFMKASR